MHAHQCAEDEARPAIQKPKLEDVHPEESQHGLNGSLDQMRLMYLLRSTGVPKNEASIALEPATPVAR